MDYKQRVIENWENIAESIDKITPHLSITTVRDLCNDVRIKGHNTKDLEAVAMDRLNTLTESDCMRISDIAFAVY